MFRTQERTGANRQVDSQLRLWSQQLHDLSGRNRLLYYHETKASSAVIQQPAFWDLFRILVERGQLLTVPLPRADDTPLPGQSGNPVPDLEDVRDLLPESRPEGEDPFSDPDETSPGRPLGRPALPQALTEKKTPAGSPASKKPAQRKSNEIATNHSVSQLNRVLYNLRYAARTVEEEQGLNILYVTFGMLHWREYPNSGVSRAPLVLVPVRVERERPSLPYRIRMADEEIIVNPVLQVKLLRDFGIELPAVSNDLTASQLRQFMDAVGDRVAEFDGWRVEEQAILGAFSFLGLLLIKDFETYAPLYERHPLVRWLSGIEPEGPTATDPLPRAEDLDDAVDPVSVFQVLDADSSQQEAIEAAKRGLSFILQGPPGTGKSQTITNVIAESLMAGKRVLFVSQKLAALEVVRDRLARKGLGEYCLEVHSHRMDKRKVVGELMTSLAGDHLRVRNPEFSAQRKEIREVRTELNLFVRELHEPQPQLGLSLYELNGRLSHVLDAPSWDFGIPDIEAVTPEDLSQMVRAVREIGSFEQIIRSHGTSRWQGFRATSSTMEEREQLARQFARTAQAIASLHELLERTVGAYGLDSPASLEQDLEFAHVLMVFRSEVFSPAYEGAVLRYRGLGLSDGKYLSLQYGGDSAKLRRVLRPGRAPGTRDIAAAVATIVRAMRGGRDRGASGDAGISGEEDASGQIENHLEAIEQGYAIARGLFHEENMPALLRDLYQQPALDAASWFLEHAEKTAELQDWANLNAVLQTARERRLEDFVRVMLEHGVSGADLESAFTRRFYELLIDRILARSPRLQRFRGATHTSLIARFRQLDMRMIERSANEIRARLHQQKPQRSWMTASSAETSILRREYNKKRRLKPLRRLFGEIPHLVQTLKPCLMMSPITVCQLLDPSVHQFDLAVFDEASQIPPEYAVSAFLRTRQVIIAGDRQQLPPMSFFQTMEGEEPEENNGRGGAEFESILTLCDSRGFPNKMLNWHYRSRDESLIAYSNYHFYDNRLFTFPNSRLDNPRTGLKFIHVEDGLYQPGEGARYNLPEARRVAELALEHFVQRPDLSLGIVAFSGPQRRAIEAAMDRLRVRHEKLNARFGGDTAEPVFIKNLENVQGDERDVIILSVGYGRDEHGRFALNFGPLNRDGGARRLNVAVTRARHLLYLVSSVQPEEIDLGRASSQGAALLRDYLMVARDGVRAIIQEHGEEDGAETEVLFEEAVFEELTKRGLQLAKRVGTSEYRIDLAVRDPDEPGRFVLGLECDGTMYRSGLTARDRDRLREQVLAGLGWRIHHIWSRDWIRDREGEVQKILNLLESMKSDDPPPAIAASRAKDLAHHTPTPNLPTQPMDLEDSTMPLMAWTYTPPTLARSDHRGKHDLLAAPPSVLIDELQKLATEEGPIAIRTAKAAISRAWGTRLDAETGERLSGAIEAGAKQGAFRLNGNFLWPMGLKVAPLRVHAPGQARRRLEDVAPEEIAAALRACVQGALTIGREDLIRETAKLFGARATTENVAIIDQVAADLIDHRVLAMEAGRVGRGPAFDASLH